MPYVITDACIGNKDGACYAVCPVDAIHPTRDEPGFEEAEQLFVDPDECIDCDACLQECPVNAIVPGEELTDDQADQRERNAAYYA